MASTKISDLPSGAPAIATDQLPVARAGTNVKLTVADIWNGTGAGAGMASAAGIATTDVAAFSLTRTNNNAAVVKGVEITYTDTTSAAGFLPLAIRGGAAGATDLLTLSKAGAGTFASTVTGGGATPFTASASGSNVTSNITNTLNTGVAIASVTNNGGNVASLIAVGTAYASGAGVVAAGSIGIQGTSTAGLYFLNYASGPIKFGTNSGFTEQVRILDTASASRYITLTGSNGGNPAIGVSAGSLAITPAIVGASTMDATAYKVGGVSGVANFGPSVVTSITVVGGIITAIS